MRSSLYLVGILGIVGSLAILWLDRLHPPVKNHPIIVDVKKPQTQLKKSIDVPSKQQVRQVWNRQLRQPLYDPPPPAPKPPPPPPPMIPIDLLGRMDEKGRSFVLLNVGSSGQKLLGVGERFNASGTEIEVLAISLNKVQLRVGTREVTLEKKK